MNSDGNPMLSMKASKPTMGSMSVGSSYTTAAAELALVSFAGQQVVFSPCDIPGEASPEFVKQFCKWYFFN